MFDLPLFKRFQQCLCVALLLSTGQLLWSQIGYAKETGSTTMQRDGFEVAAKIVMNDGRIFDPTVTVVAGKEATVTFVEPNDSPFPTVELRLMTGTKSDQEFFVKTQVLQWDKKSRRWVIINDVEALAKLNQTVSLSTGDDGYIEFVAKPVDIETDINTCEKDTSSDYQTFGDGAISIGGDEKSCCSVLCADNSGRMLKCCGSRCAGCGSSCSPN
ncbi:hypothetical protein [Idiomarina xiamenensis]|uniref:Uncharacterized protein n=1 Tax=Idiomarina xiamenensis 10-D-4 TaxID=740709 RepID=K2K6T6_9GAMM|nr:hypothetical protein [Idiomarina xiamenensis]EKE83368.1 hypothetical protein A10D4_08092 [Idiomarina xiamenensis 10-D-4]